MTQTGSWLNLVDEDFLTTDYLAGPLALLGLEAGVDQLAADDHPVSGVASSRQALCLLVPNHTVEEDRRPLDPLCFVVAVERVDCDAESSDGLALWSEGQLRSLVSVPAVSILSSFI